MLSRTYLYILIAKGYILLLFLLDYVRSVNILLFSPQGDKGDPGVSIEGPPGPPGEPGIATTVNDDSVVEGEAFWKTY